MEATTTMVNVRIDASKPAGRKILRELESKKCVEIEDDPIPAGHYYTHEEMKSHFFGKIKSHFGVEE
jgi:hypothetical protein